MAEMNLMRNPITPSTETPRMLILIDSQSSSRPGLLANFKSRLTDSRKDDKPNDDTSELSHTIERLHLLTLLFFLVKLYIVAFLPRNIHL